MRFRRDSLRSLDPPVLRATALAGAGEEAIAAVISVALGRRFGVGVLLLLDHISDARAFAVRGNPIIVVTVVRIAPRATAAR
jgi:hypothetical protein